MSSVILITGIQAAGKSTVAQLVAKALPRSAHVRGDAFRRMVVGGRCEMVPEPPEEAIRQLHLRYRLGAMVSDGYAEAGFTAVLQDIILGADLAEVVARIRTRPRYVVVLAPRPEVVAVREAGRSKTAYDDFSVAMLDDALRTGTPPIGLWLDSSDQTAQQTAEEILSRVWTDGLVDG